ncbi:hypothetical protein [Pelagicoccus sp. SDUM812003]|uniref:hypothetical protein n=1 Tax=Pelagicoccus sp. SDUM812003 TaxID=3041267 RepID=UPI00280C6DDC|nr:hypothetical protein [Pelagicoccus sp. SDUM812003]MDQ8203972.1 hypothetical protein [Pelagicoccus sp. SDUM812003]
MKNEPTREDIDRLKSMRGSFGPTKKENVQSLFFCWLVMVCFPVFFVWSAFSKGTPFLPLSENQWTLLAMSPVAFLFGHFLKKYTGLSYRFDGTSIQQIFRNGKVFKEVEIDKLIEIKETSKGVICLSTERSWLNLVITKELKKELAEPGGPYNSGQALRA